MNINTMQNIFELRTNIDSFTSIPFFSQNHQPQELYKELSISNKKAYQCTFYNCGKIFNFKSETMRHILIHQQERPYICTFDDCKKSFKRSDTLETHMRTHKEVLPFLCDISECGQRFASKAALRYHKIRHDNKRSYKCDYPGCDKAFLTSSQLKQHQGAFNPHGRQSSPKDRKQEPPTKIVKCEPSDSNEGSPKREPDTIEVASGNIRTQNSKGDCIDDFVTNEFTKIYSSLLIENLNLKGKLEDHQKSKDYFQNNQIYGLQAYSPIQLSPLKGYSTIVSNSEITFLDLLQKQENNS